MNSETEPTLREVNVLPSTALVSKQNGIFLPLFSPHDVNRDNFIQLRKELITLGCHQKHVITTARDLCMQVLNMTDVHAYNMYILSQTYTLCDSEIRKRYNTEKIPIQDLGDLKYSHIDLFSSIYRFEIEYLRKIGVKNSVCDIGCGDGLFLRLLNDHEIEATGYDIELKQVSHPVPIKKIMDIEDIDEFFQVITLNHVLEHIEERPSDFLDRLIHHINSRGQRKLQAIIISLPLHLSLQAHLASGHHWVCYHTELSTPVLNQVEERKLKFFHANRELDRVAKRHGYKLSVHEKIGTYVIE